jgi:hypothetical protein
MLCTDVCVACHFADLRRPLFLEQPYFIYLVFPVMVCFIAVLAAELYAKRGSFRSEASVWLAIKGDSS